MSIPISASSLHNNQRREALFFGLAFLFLGAGALGLSLAPAARQGSWAALAQRWQHWLLLPIWLACVVAVRRMAARRMPLRDSYLLPAGFLLAGWGTLVVWRLLPEFGLRQTGWLVVASVLLILVLRAGDDLQWLRRYRYLWLVIGLALTALTLVFGTHPSGGEPRLWLGCCGLFFQPSELLRLMLVVYIAAYLADRLSLPWDQSRSSTFGVMVPLVMVWGLSIALLFVQRDLGTGSLVLALLAVLLYLASGRRGVLLLGAGMVLAGGAAAALSFSLVRSRLIGWIDPWSDPTGLGYQIIQSTLAISAGGLFGQGVGFGAPGLIPAVHTDFIFSAIAEEWGLAGGLALLSILALVISRGLRIAARRVDTFQVMLAAGLSASLGLQCLLILGGVLRLLPLTGVTLPFVSYGGSSLVASFISLGLLLQMSVRQEGANPYRPQLMRLHAGLLLGWLAVALAFGWWAVVRAPDLVRRSDNPRRAIAARLSPRGMIYDRAGGQLAGRAGDRGSFERTYPAPAAVAAVGFDSATYGQAGLEASLDPYLRGLEGNDPLDVWWTELLSAAPPAGLDVRLTLSLPLQREAMALLEGRTGAAVVIDGQRGEVLVLASQPTFDPGGLEANWVQLASDPRSPLLSRPAQASYQPGAALGPLFFAWALEHDLTLPAPHADLARPIPVNGELLQCVQPPTADSGAAPSLAQALRAGCPAPWFSLAEQLAPSEIVAFVEAFGLNQATGLRLPQAGSGWDGSTMEAAAARQAFAIGQGNLTVTPVQMVRAFAGLAQDGALPELKLADAVRQPGAAWSTLEASGAPVRAISPQSAAQVRRSLGASRPLEYSARAVAGEGGTELGWYLAALPDHPNHLVVVIVLEADTASQARALGLALIGQAERLLP